MNTDIKNLFLLPALIAGLSLIPVGRVTAQTFTNLHNFVGWPSEGACPTASLLLSGNILYGTTSGGGSYGHGTVFKVNADGTAFTHLYSFTGGVGYSGSSPRAGLILSGNTLYGTASMGGDYGYGRVFAINTDGTGFTSLHDFASFDGMYPLAGLILAGNTLYGTTRGDSEYSAGTVFAVNTDGTGFSNVHDFGAIGFSPLAGLVLSGNTLYGTTQGGGGGGSGNGMVFAVNTDGTGFTNVHTFRGANGAQPVGGLVLSGNTLYGTTTGLLNYTPGTVFKVNTDGTGFTTLHTATGTGAGVSVAELILSGNTLYGTKGGGSLGGGAVFAIHTDGTGFTNLYNFTALPDAGGPPYTNSDGAYPWAGLILSGNTLYGTASQGGIMGQGTVFSLSLPPPPPQLTITRSGANVILTWPTNAAGFALQSTTNLFPTAWSPVAQTAVTNAGQISVTVPTTVGRKFFRLKSQ